MTCKMNFNNIFTKDFAKLYSESDMSDVILKVTEELGEVIEARKSNDDFDYDVVSEALDLAQAAITLVSFVNENDKDFNKHLTTWLDKQELRKEEYGVK